MRIAFIYDIRENVFGVGQDGHVTELATELFSASEANGIILALKELGHTVTVIDGAAEFLARLPGLREEVDFVFNEAKGLYGPDRKMAVPALCRIHRIPFLGSDAYAVTLCRNKFHTLAVAALEKVPVPESLLVRSASDAAAWQSYPAIVKPNYESASIGISGKSVVNDAVALRRQVEYVIEEYDQPALVQEFVQGIEVQVSVVGNTPPVPFSPTSLTTAASEANPYGIVRNEDWIGGAVRVEPYAGSSVEPLLRATAVHCFQALGCSDYGRLDFRVTPAGQIRFIEAATHPHITAQSAFAAAAALNGLSFTEMIDLLVSASIQRQSAH
jgi:D-alanine-D-alanine ligase